MRRICPKCRLEPEDDRLFVCETCKVPFIDSSQIVRAFTQDELKEIARLILKDKRAYGLAAILLVVATLILLWPMRRLITRHVQEFSQAASNQVYATYSQTTNNLATQFQAFTNSAHTELAATYKVVTNEIHEQFKTPRIREIVDTVAKTEAKAILEAEVKPSVDKFTEDAEFMRTVARAQAHDFKAFQELVSMSVSTNQNAQFAHQVLKELDRTILRHRTESDSNRRYAIISTDGKLDKGPFAVDEVIRIFERMPEEGSLLNREAFALTARDYKEPMFLPYLVGWLTNETDLLVANRITLAISELAGREFSPRDLNALLEWWATNRITAKAWPQDIQDEARELARTKRSEEAVTRLNIFLERVPNADMTRAFAVVQYAELGQMDKAAALKQGFADKDGPWANWATSLLMVRTGDHSNGTVRLRQTTTKFPRFKVSEGNELYKGVDWALYNSLESKRQNE